MWYGHSQGGWTGNSLNDNAIAPLAHGLHSCSQLVRNLTSMRNELSKDPIHHLEESNARIQADNFDRRKLWERQCNDRFDTSGLYATVFIVVSVKLPDASVMVKNALQIGKDCMETYGIKLPQGLYNKISNYVVTMNTPMEEGLTREQSQLLTLKPYST